MKQVHIHQQKELDELAKIIRKDLPGSEYAIGATYPGNGGGGGRGCDQNDTGVTTHGYCYRRGIKLCDMSRVGGAVYEVAATSSFEVQIVPSNVQYFEPVAAAAVVVQNGNINANARCLFSAWVIGGSPQEPIDNRNPTATTTEVVLSDHFLPTDYGPKPVPWGIFSVAALTKPLQIFGFNPNGVAIDIFWLIYGNPIPGDLPSGLRTGETWEEMRTNPYFRNRSFFHK